MFSLQPFIFQPDGPLTPPFTTMTTEGIRDIPNPPVMITFYADLRSLVRPHVDDLSDDDNETEPGWDMVPLLHVRTLSQLRSSTVEDLKKRAQHYIWDQLQVAVSTSTFVTLLSQHFGFL